VLYLSRGKLGKRSLPWGIKPDFRIMVVGLDNFGVIRDNLLN
jgi:hypothetical protein